MNVRRSPARHEAGFTLIELLVSITLLALLTTLLFGGLRIAARGSAAIGQRVANGQEVGFAYDFMTNVLIDAQPLKTGSAVDAPVDFAGERQAFDFIALLPPDITVGGFFRFHVFLEQLRAGERRLVVSEMPWSHARTEPVPYGALPSILLDGVARGTFAYYGPPGPNLPAVWNDRWTDHRSLPQLIRLRLVLADGTQAPDLIIAPRLAGPPAP